MMRRPNAGQVGGHCTVDSASAGATADPATPEHAPRKNDHESLSWAKLRLLSFAAVRTFVCSIIGLCWLPLRAGNFAPVEVY